MISRSIFRGAVAATQLLALAGALHAQCAERFVENLKSTNDQRLVTVPQLLVVRASYAYSLGLSATQEGVQGLFTSRGGNRPDRGDELLLINKVGERKVFRFVDQPSTNTKGGVPVYGNVLQLDFATVAWLASADVTTVTLIDNTTNQGRRFTIPTSRQAEFRHLVQCFGEAASREVIPDVPAVSTSIPSVARAPAPPLTGESGLTPKPGTTTLAAKQASERIAVRRELADLQQRLEDTRRGLLEQLALEKAKAKRARDRIADEVVASRKAAETEKNAIAADVLAARERADRELARLGRETADQRERARVGTEAQVAENATAVRVAHESARSAITQAKRSAAEEIAVLRARQAEAAILERARYAEAESAYAAQVATAKERSQMKIIDIRRQLEIELTETRRAATQVIDSSSASAAEARLAARKEVLNAREASLKAIAAFRETAAAEAAKRDERLAEARRDQVEALAAAEAVHASRIAQIETERIREREAFAAERSRMRDSVLTERKRLNALLDSARQEAIAGVAATRRKAAAEAANLEAGIEHITSLAAKRVRQIQNEEAIAITRARERSTRQRDSLASAFAAEREYLRFKRDEERRALAAQYDSINAKAARAARRDSLVRVRSALEWARQRDARRQASETDELERQRAYEQRIIRRTRQLDSLTSLVAERERRARSLVASVAETDTIGRRIARASLRLSGEEAALIELRRLNIQERASAQNVEDRQYREARKARLAIAEAEADTFEAEARRRSALARETLSEVERVLASQVNAAQERAIDEQEALLADLNSIRQEHTEALSNLREELARERSTVLQAHIQAIDSIDAASRLDRDRLQRNQAAYERSLRNRRDELERSLTVAVDSARVASTELIEQTRTEAAAAVTEIQRAAVEEAARSEELRRTLREREARMRDEAAARATDLLNELAALEDKRTKLEVELAALERERIAAKASATPD